MLDDKVDLIVEVVNLKAKAWAMKEYLKKPMLTRDAEIAEAVEQAVKEAVEKFKDSEEFAALIEKNMRRVMTRAMMLGLWTFSTTSSSSTEILTMSSWGRSS